MHKHPGGRLEVEATDRFATDEAVFRPSLAALAGVKITKVILPGFDTAKAPKWCEAY